MAFLFYAIILYFVVFATKRCLTRKKNVLTWKYTVFIHLLIFNFSIYISYRSRIMIPPTKACRTLLHQYISGAQFTTTQMESLCEMLLTTCPSIILFLEWLTHAYDDVSDCPRSIKILVKVFAACSFVCGFVHPSESLHTLLKLEDSSSRSIRANWKYCKKNARCCSMHLQIFKNQ